MSTETQTEAKMSDAELSEALEREGANFVDHGDTFSLNGMELEAANLSDALFEAWALAKPDYEVSIPAATAVTPDLGAEALEWMANIKEATREVSRLDSVFHEKNEAAKRAKKKYETAVEDLQALILREPEPMPLFDKKGTPEAIVKDAFAALLSVGHAEPIARKLIDSILESGKTFTSVTEMIDAIYLESMGGVPGRDPSEAWKEEPIAKLGLPASIAQKLSEQGIDSLGDLSRWQEKKQLTDVPGIGRGSADKIEAALITFWEDNRQHEPTPEADAEHGDI